MSRWTSAFASMILLAFSLPAAAEDTDLPRNIELKPGASVSGKSAEDAGSGATTRQIVTEGKDAPPADAPKEAGAAAKPNAPAEAGKAPEPGQAAAPPAPTESEAEAAVPAEAGVAGPPAPEPEPGNLALAIQTELKRVGCDPGDVDGVWGGRSREALAAFGHFAKVDVANLAPTPEIFDIIKGKTAVVCAVEAEGAEAPPPAHHAAPRRPHGYGGYGGGGGGY
ncbi:MAG: peptidoglycan-binding domain-containing protein [Methyloceanibacter sp.]